MTSLMALVLAGTTGAFAQEYPVRPIRLVVPYAAGGGVDIIARAIAQELSRSFGQSVVVENRTGASGTIGGDFVAKAAPDGYTLLMIGTPYVITPSLLARLPYDPVKDFAPITQVTSQPYIMGVHPSLPARSVREFVALAKSRPGQLNYASAGPGTTPHLATELLKTLTGIDVVHVPYNGGAPAAIALISGEVAMLWGTLPPFLPMVKAGKVRALAVSSLSRSPSMPGLPTVAESGVPGFEVISWFGLLAPARTPSEIVTRLHAQVVNLLRTPAIKDRLAADGSDAVGSAPAELGAYIQSEIAKWGKVVKSSGMRVD